MHIELSYGMHAMLLAIQSICQAFSLTPGKVTLGCDNLGVISQLCYPKKTISCSCKHVDLLHASQGILCLLPIQVSIFHVRSNQDSQLQFPKETVSCSCKQADLIQACKALLRLLPIYVSLVHVQGHQDSLLPFAALDCIAQLNSMANELAKKHLHLAISQGIPSLPVGPLFGESWSCSLSSGAKLTSNPHGLVLLSLSSPLVQEYLSHCHLLPMAAFPLVNWPAIGCASSASPLLYHLWISKFASGHSAVGHMMLKHGEWDNDHCPCCSHSPKTTRHMISCHDPCMSATIQSAICKFSHWLTSVETHPSISSCFMASLSSHQVLLFCPC